MDPSPGDFTHDIDEFNDCAIVQPCLYLHLGYSPHEIDVDESVLDLDALETFVEHAIAGEKDSIHLPGEECGEWSCENGTLNVQLYSYGAWADNKVFDFSEVDGRWAKRLRSIVETIRQWRARDVQKYVKVYMGYDGKARVGEYDDETPEREWRERHIPTPEEKVRMEEAGKRFKKILEQSKREEEQRREAAQQSNATPFLDLVGLGPQDYMLMNR